MSKIVFVNEVNFESCATHMPIGILSLSSILKSKKFDVEILDFNYLLKKGLINKCNNIKDNIFNIGDYILAMNPNIVDFYTMCNSYHISIMIAKYIKEKKKDIKILFGGPQATLTAEATLKAFPWIDIIGLGEGENIIEKLILSLENDSNLIEVSAIAYRDSNGIVYVNKRDALIDNLDKLPAINYNLIDMQYYDYTSIEAGRGCPFGCAYCSSKTFWKRKFRLKSAKRIFEEIKELKESYNRNIFSLEHDLFTFNKEKVIELCNMIIDEELNISWDCSARVDTLDEKMIAIMSKSGCKGIYLGIETGSQRMQKIINKNLSLDKVWPCIDTLIKEGIQPTISFIYGFPEETLEDVRCTLEMVRIAKERKIKNVQLHLCTVLPGTELYKSCKDTLVLADNSSDIVGFADITEFKDMISNYPDIFSQFYDIKIDLRHELKYLDTFIMEIYSPLYNNFNVTFKLLLKYYNDDLLELFLNFKRHFHLFRSLLDRESTRSELSHTEILTRIDMISDFINNNYFEFYSDILKEFFQFEKDIFNFSISLKKEEINSYKLDVLMILRMHSKYSDDFRNPVTLKFTKSEMSKVKVSRLKNRII